MLRRSKNCCWFAVNDWRNHPGSYVHIFIGHERFVAIFKHSQGLHQEAAPIISIANAAYMQADEILRAGSTMICMVIAIDWGSREPSGTP